MKFEAARILFLSDVFVVVALLVAYSRRKMLALACGGVKYRKRETNENVTVEQGTAKNIY